MARVGSSSGDAAAGERAGGAGRSEPWELSLEEVLKAYEQPINEEQAWAVCFQCCRGLRGAPGGRRRWSSPPAYSRVDVVWGGFWFRCQVSGRGRVTFSL